MQMYNIYIITKSPVEGLNKNSLHRLVGEGVQNASSNSSALSLPNNGAAYKGRFRLPMACRNSNEVLNVLTNYGMATNLKTLVEEGGVYVSNIETDSWTFNPRVNVSLDQTYAYGDLLVEIANNLYENDKQFVRLFKQDLGPAVPHLRNARVVSRLGVVRGDLEEQARKAMASLVMMSEVEKKAKKQNTTAVNFLGESVIYWLKKFPEDEDLLQRGVTKSDELVSLAKLFPQNRHRYFKRMDTHYYHHINEWMDRFPQDAEFLIDNIQYSAWLYASIAQKAPGLAERAADKVTAKDIGVFSTTYRDVKVKRFLMFKHGLIDKETYEREDRLGRQIMMNLAFVAPQRKSENTGRWRYFVIYCNLLDTAQMKKYMHIFKRFIAVQTATNDFFRPTLDLFNEGIVIESQKRSEFFRKLIRENVMSSGMGRIRSVVKASKVTPSYAGWEGTNSLGGPIFPNDFHDKTFKRILMEITLKQK